MASGGPQKRWSPEEVAAALAVVKSCGGNVSLASRQAGVPYRSLVRWARDAELRGDLAAAPMTHERRRERIRQAIPKAEKDLAEKLEAIAHGCCNAITPRKMRGGDLRGLATTAAIAIDKMRLLREQPPPPGRAEVAMSEAMAIAAQAMVAMAKAAGHEISEQDAAAKIREIQLDRSTLATELTQ